jgi:large conductance mechanosensitive channel
MSFLKEFKEFAMRGNVVDLAVAVIIGAAFGKIITSLVDGIIMPLIGLIIGGVNIAGKSLTVGDAVVKWGVFLQTIIDFTLIALSIFIAIKFINLLKRKEEEQEPKLTPVEVLLTEIRDLMSERKLDE